MKIRLTLITKLGNFVGEEQTVNEEECSKILEYSNTFHLSDFDMILEDKSIVFFPPNITSESILKINISYV